MLELYCVNIIKLNIGGCFGSKYMFLLMKNYKCGHSLLLVNLSNNLVIVLSCLKVWLVRFLKLF